MSKAPGWDGRCCLSGGLYEHDAGYWMLDAVGPVCSEFRTSYGSIWPQPRMKSLVLDLYRNRSLVLLALGRSSERLR